VIIKAEYDYAYSFDSNLADVKKNGKWGFVDKYGKKIIPLEYDTVGFFGEKRVVWAKKMEKWGVINNVGDVIINFDYDEVRDFNEGLASVKKDNKWGFIDLKGGLVIDFVYEDSVLLLLKIW